MRATTMPPNTTHVKRASASPMCSAPRNSSALWRPPSPLSNSPPPKHAMISCPTTSCQGDRCPSFSGLPAIARPITLLRQLGNGTRLIIVCLYASVRPHGGLSRPALIFIPVSERGALLHPRRQRGGQLPVALLDAARPLVPGNDDADMVRASPLACRGDFLLRLAGC